MSWLIRESDEPVGVDSNTGPSLRGRRRSTNWHQSIARDSQYQRGDRDARRGADAKSGTCTLGQLLPQPARVVVCFPPLSARPNRCSINTSNLCSIVFATIGKAIRSIAATPSVSISNTINCDRSRRQTGVLPLPPFILGYLRISRGYTDSHDKKCNTLRYFDLDRLATKCLAQLRRRDN